MEALGQLPESRCVERLSIVAPVQFCLPLVFLLQLSLLISELLRVLLDLFLLLQHFAFDF